MSNGSSSSNSNNSSSGGLALMLQRLRGAVPLGGWSYRPTAPDTPDSEADAGAGPGAAGDVEGLLAGANNANSGGAGGGTRGGIGALMSSRPALRLLEGYGERRRRFLGRFKVFGLVCLSMPARTLR